MLDTTAAPLGGASPDRSGSGGTGSPESEPGALPPGTLDTVEGRKLALHFLNRDITELKAKGLKDPDARERLAALERRQDALADSMKDHWFTPLLDFASGSMGRKGFGLAVAASLLFGLGYLLDSCGDRLLDIGEQLVTEQARQSDAAEDQAVAAEELVDEVGAPLTPERDTVATLPVTADPADGARRTDAPLPIHLSR